MSPLIWGEPSGPTPYLRKGWLVSQGNLLESVETKASTWDSYLTTNMDGEDVRLSLKASWSVGKKATMSLPVPACNNGECFILLGLRGFLTEENNFRQKVLAHVHGEEICEWNIDTDHVIPKLMIVPVRNFDEREVLEITLDTPDAVMNESVLTAPSKQELGVELYSVTILDGRENYLLRLQKIWEDSCKYRNELINVEEGWELQDRGEFVEIVENVLTVFNETKEDYSSVREKLLNFLADPYLSGTSNDQIVFDEHYYLQKYEELKEGKIEHEIIKWKHDLFQFKEAVLDAGNYAFRQLSTEDYESYTLLDNFLKENEFTAEKLKELKDKNEKLNNLEILLRKNELESVPPLLEIEMTSFCNFRCVMCSRSMMKFLHIQQNDQQILQISEILPYIKYVTIAGVGEPCSSKKLDLLSRVLELFHCPTLMFTNGSLLHNQLEAASRFTKVNISFDGPNEEILGAQRRNSKFKTIVKNIKKLRKKAPQLHIGFSVVVSRINVDEIAAIVQLADDLGVNAVNLSPVFNVFLLELKESDREIYEQQLGKAMEIAKNGSVIVNNNVHAENYSTKNDSPREKEKLIKYFSKLEVPKDISHNVDKVVNNLERVHFSYFPDKIIFPTNRWPKVKKPSGTVVDEDGAGSTGFEFNIDEEIERLDKAITTLTHEVKAKPKDWFKLPYCLSVWKYGYVKSNGKNRLCPYRNITVGSYRKEGPLKVLNSQVVKKYRESMFDVNDTLPMCQGCLDHHRKWSIKRVDLTCKELGLDISSLEKVGW